MKIALDYDGTFTEDKEMWTAFVSLCKGRGHDVRFVTFRVHYYEPWARGNEDILADAANLDIPVIFTNGEQKQKFFDADVWIDDHPELISEASSVNQQDLYEARRLK